ncbi:ATP-binding protein [Patescibacteria group bacterium]|nr:ATP-binding protein [Patescibacteria group bacterium]
MNPCPCGYFGDPDRECRCTGSEVFRYAKRISGPFLDRIDIQLNIPRVDAGELIETHPDPSGETAAKERVARARGVQMERFKGHPSRTCSNAEMTSRMVDEIAGIDPNALAFVKETAERDFLSARGYYRTLKVARTIADLDGESTVKKDHLAEAFQYRLRVSG